MQNLLTFASLMAATSAVLSYPYPVLGSKRYSRTNLVPPSEYGGSLSPFPLYSPIAQYLPVPAYGPDYYDDGSYYNGNGFYYVPQLHRRYQRNERYPTSYGLPTYRGEYKPTPYYYAHGPSYSYSDDRESNNPLDDLHEEMLQEDERERGRDYFPVGQEQWYESPTRPHSAFLRNLILYNHQLNAAGRNPKDYDSAEEEYDDYEEGAPEYYDSPAMDNRNYIANAIPNTFAKGNGNGNGNSNGNSNRNAYNKLDNLRGSLSKNQIEDDEDVQELKSLIHQQKSSQKNVRQQQALLPERKPIATYQPTPLRSLSNDYQQYVTDNWQRDSPSFGNYEYDNEYDDSWNHWDRKRNVQPKKASVTATTVASGGPHTTTTTTTTTSTSTTRQPVTSIKPKVQIIKTANGQKEVVLPRPANPARNPFALNTVPAVSTIAGSSPVASKASGKFYDTIKKIIDMQQNLEGAELRQQLENQKQQSRIQKRFISSEGSLVQQLDGLKRTA